MVQSPLSKSFTKRCPRHCNPARGRGEGFPLAQVRGRAGIRVGVASGWRGTLSQCQRAAGNLNATIASPVPKARCPRPRSRRTAGRRTAYVIGVARRARRQRRLPELAAGLDIERADGAVQRRADEDEARRRSRSVRPGWDAESAGGGGAPPASGRRGAERNVPQDAARRQADRDQRAERRRRARQAVRADHEHAAAHDVRRAVHPRVLAVAEPRVASSRRRARGRSLRRRMSWTIAAMRLTGTTAIWRASSTATPPQCAPPMFDGTTSVPSRLGGVKIPSLRSAAIWSRHAARSSGVGAPRVVRGVGVRAQRRSDRVNGCVGEASSPGTVLAGTGRSSTGKIGSPVSRFEDEEHARLRRLQRRRERVAPLRTTVTSAGGDGVVVVPQVVMHGLEVPDDLPRRGAQRDDRVGVAVVAEALAAEVVGAGSRRHEDEVALRVGRDHRPDVRRARRARRCRPARSRHAGSRRVLRDRDPNVQRSSPVRASKPRTSPLAGARPAVVGDGGAGDDESAHHRRRRRHLVRLELEGRDAQARRRSTMPSSPKPRTARPWPHRARSGARRSWPR